MPIWIGNIEVIVTGSFVRIAHVAPECYGMIKDPELFIRDLKRHGHRADLLAFGQRLPDVKPSYPYFMVWDEIAALRITTYENWLGKQIIKENRKNIAKAEKKGIKVAEADYSDEFVAGIVNIYNESPIRQGKAFWHYKKDYETVKRENGTYLDRSIFIGAYWDKELIGFVKLVLTDRCASTLQVISMIGHRDKKPTNALLAKAVEICASMNIPFLQYGLWSEGTLGDFKRHNGFEKIRMPKYYVPITMKGRLMLKWKLHQGIKHMFPDRLLTGARMIRRRFNEYKYGK
jgi:hypothetical protein